ncbi:AAA family ATPase [Kribbella sandramycini]|uniref:AAA family ATPase n=1 Tax=Kribbella sandramycini TaxID=60450 RepID=A0A7Y4KWQ4_9ACTN|nr:LuxR family transcriptional regulator [Kribbella sandramycini]MBB6567989.1 DNA-binding CsgD family transcriptional regulator [Kribbella sandramycini]NOL39417.1 AAA family ATPase [Kribbella sandramycini]
MQFVARAKELQVLAALTQGAADGAGGAIVVLGEPGIGKSTLIETATAQLAGWTILRADGTEFERDLPYAALHQLCAPVIEARAGLPEVQRQALESVFGLAAGTTPSPLLVGLAVLGLLNELPQPVCCVVDDLQWIDDGTRQVLGFVARRIAAEGIAMILAGRPDGAGFPDLPQLPLTGLDENDAQALLRTTGRAGLDSAVLDRILAEARGNPLALLEFGPEPGLPDAPRTGVVEALQAGFARRVRRLPTATQELLALAAAEPVGDLGLLRRAAKRLDLNPAALAAAEDDGLLTLGPRLRFRHPLVRAAAYDAVTPGTRRTLHAALADATDDQIDPDRRAWHRAHAVIDTDAEVAAELTRAAERTQLRGDFASAAAFLERAADLTPEPADQTTRLLAASRLRLKLGAFDRARELLTEADRRPLDAAQRAEARLQTAQIDVHLTRSPEATAALVAAAGEVDDPTGTYIEAFSSAMFIDRFPGRLRQLGVRIRAQVPPRDHPRPSDLLLDALLDQAMLPVADAVPAMRRAVDAFRTPDLADPWWMELACMMALDLHDSEATDEIAARQVELARRQSALAILPQALKFQAIGKTMFGRFAEAEAGLAEANAVDEAAGSVSLAFADVILAAWRGNAEHFDQLRSSIHDRVGRDELVAALYATAVLRNGLGDYTAALEAARTAYAERERGSYVVWPLAAEYIEAAARAGQPAEATPAVEQLEALARTNPTPWAVAQHHLAQALIDPAAAEVHYREAIDLFAQTDVRAQHARARLAYGEWLRRGGRRAEARVELQAAHESLTAMGAAAFAERAARELSATGQRPRREGTNPLDQLTAQERLIATQVAGGATSKEVAATLFLSPRTIDTHLRNIFRKLDITSRRQLREVI